MKIYDENWNELNNPDPMGGVLSEGVRVVHHDAVDAVVELGHYETIAKYPGGGEDVRWVVDVPGVTGHPAYDEEEACLIWRALTAQEKAQQAAPSMAERLEAMEGAMMAMLMGGEA